MTICILTALIISVSLSTLIGISWIKRTRNSNINLNAEALRNPINTGITVAGFLLPIIVGLISFLYLKTDLKIQREDYLYSSIVLIIISIFWGLWNNYSLATLTKIDGSFPITKKENTIFPAIFVFQLALLFWGLLYLGLFSFNNIKPDDTEKVSSVTLNTKPIEQIAILKPHIIINTHKDSLLNCWGKPSKISLKDSLQIFWYKSTYSDFSYTIKNDTIININENPKK